MRKQSRRAAHDKKPKKNTHSNQWPGCSATESGNPSCPGFRKLPAGRGAVSPERSFAALERFLHPDHVQIIALLDADSGKSAAGLESPFAVKAKADGIVGGYGGQ